MVEAVERYPGRGTEGSTKRPVLVHYVLARHGGGGPELLHVTLESGEEALPVFSSRRTAQSFLFSNALRQGWYARASYAGELVSLLYGLYAGIEWVQLDPLPEHPEDTPANLMRWEDFVDYLLV
jgi:hypothetical protein